MRGLIHPISLEGLQPHVCIQPHPSHPPRSSQECGQTHRSGAVVYPRVLAFTRYFLDVLFHRTRPMGDSIAFAARLRKWCDEHGVELHKDLDGQHFEPPYANGIGAKKSIGRGTAPPRMPIMWDSSSCMNTLVSDMRRMCPVHRTSHAGRAA